MGPQPGHRQHGGDSSSPASYMACSSSTAALVWPHVLGQQVGGHVWVVLDPRPSSGRTHASPRHPLTHVRSHTKVCTRPPFLLRTEHGECRDHWNIHEHT